MHNISNLFYFGTALYVSGGLSVQHQESKTVRTASGICRTQHIPDAVCTVLDSWCWMERPPETCRVLFQNKINLRYCASSWSYYRNITKFLHPVHHIRLDKPTMLHRLHLNPPSGEKQERQEPTVMGPLETTNSRLYNKQFETSSI